MLRSVNAFVGHQDKIFVMAELGWPHTSTILAEHEFFHCGAVELARKILGQFLYCHQSKVVVRILGTEAYPEDDDIVYGDDDIVVGTCDLLWRPVIRLTSIQTKEL
ncbi:hypothetical protein KC19_8G125400 [Ceratodon purpureus]|uniref:Uncharacterized protein n=1 Tax=Ceratodon purpureus TaxID=3225 RepID=A0A8T0H2P8_CERPU|nr:hypothetical protein KC19_8G125400 [Ceratodon purpureus]